MSPPFTFKGLMAPTFTALNDDATQSVNYAIIDDYAKYLKENGVHGVLVNGTTGEGMSLTKEERIKLAEKWKVACTKHSIHLMVQVGGAPVGDVVEMAAHAESIGVDSIMCLPELYYKLKDEHVLMQYLAQVAKHCPNTPFLYYHIPMFTNVTLNIPKFLELAEQAIPNFAGLKYTSGDLEQGIVCLKQNRAVFLGSDTIFVGAIAMGFDSSIMTTLNICPDLSVRIRAAMSEEKVSVAHAIQMELNQRIRNILADSNGEWVPSMKKAVNKLGLPKLHFGPTRKPF